MPRLTIPDEDTSASFPVTTPTSVFPISFALFEKADLLVTVDDAEVSGFAFSGTLLDGGGYQGGTVTLGAPVANATVLIRRVVNPLRPSNFGSVASVPVRSVDMALNRLTATQQDVHREVGRIQFQGLTEGLDAPGARAAIGAVAKTYQALPTAPVRDLTAKITSDVRSVQDYCFDATVAGKAAVNVSNLNTALAQGANISLFGAEGKRFDFDGTVVVPEGASIQGPPSSRVVLKPVGGQTKFLSVAGDFSTLSGMFIDNSAFGGSAIRFDKAGDLQEVRIHDIQMFRPKLGIDTRGVTGKWLRTYVDNITAFALQGPMAIIERSWAFNFWGIKGPLTADFNGSLSPNHVAFQGSGGELGVAEGGFYLMAHVLGSAGQPGVTTDQRAYHFIDLPAVWLLPTTTADTCGGRSIFDGCTNLRLPFVEFGLNNEEQLELIDCAFVQGWITTRGRNEVPGAAANKSALKIGAGCGVVDLIALAYNATGHGIEHADPTATLVNIMGGRSR